eukprot:8440018-Pyramimonas_sp.AAC.1
MSCFKGCSEEGRALAVLNQWSATLHEPRFRSVMGFVKRLKGILYYLRRRWDQSACIRIVAAESRGGGGGDAGADADAGDAVNQVDVSRRGFDPSQITNALRSSHFFAYIA